MSRRQGAYAEFYWPKDLTDFVREMGDRVDDLSPVMEQISSLIRDELKARLAHGGDGEAPWAPSDPDTIRKKRKAGQSLDVGIGGHGGFGPFIGRSWSKRNAVALTVAPHAHLFDEGTKRHYSGGARVKVFGENGHHVSRPESRARLLSVTESRQHQPARPFAYLSDALIDLAPAMVLDFIIGEST
jgi:hypothetical protein